MNREILALNISKCPGSNISERIEEILGKLTDQELEDLFSNIARTAALYGPTAFNSIELI